MNRTEISTAIECWEKERLINYIEALQEVMYSACVVSFDLCDTCDLDAEECNGFVFEHVKCPNKKLREDIRAIKQEE